MLTVPNTVEDTEKLGSHSETKKQYSHSGSLVALCKVKHNLYHITDQSLLLSSHKNLYTNVYSSFYSKLPQTGSPNILQQVNIKQILIYPYDGLLLSHKKQHV